MKRHNCETQLTTVINHWVRILDNRGQINILFWASRRLLTCPPHELKSKLFGYDTGGKTLRWLDYFFATEHNELL